MYQLEQASYIVCQCAVQYTPGYILKYCSIHIHGTLNPYIGVI